MKKILLLFTILLSGSFANAQIVMGPTTNGTTINTCVGTITDSGGALGNYANSEDFTITLCPDTAGQYIQLDFSEMETEGRAARLSVPYDYLEIYEGTTIGGTLISQFGGRYKIPSLNGGYDGCVGSQTGSTDASGCITLRFRSDGGINFPGFNAAISCTTIPGGDSYNTSPGSGLSSDPLSLSAPQIFAGGAGQATATTDPDEIDCSSTTASIEATLSIVNNTNDYTIASIPFTPPYRFDCLENQVITPIGDIYTEQITIPFDFCFYGNTFNTLSINPSGAVNFDAPVGAFANRFNDDLPSLGSNANGVLPGNTIFSGYQELSFGNGGQVGWEVINVTPTSRAFIVSHYEIPRTVSVADQGISPTPIHTAMTVLYEGTNIIETYILERSPYTSSDPVYTAYLKGIIGIQNANGTAAVVAPGRNTNDTHWEVTNEAWRYTPSGTPYNKTLTWFEGSGTTGTALGSANPLTVTPTAASTVYTAQIVYTFCDGSMETLTDETTVTKDLACSFTVAATETTNTTTFCSPNTTAVNLLATPTPATAVGTYSYNWTVQGNATSLGTANTLNITPTITTIYEVTVTDSGLVAPANNASNTITITVNTTPAIPTLTSVAASCTADATSTISNYDNTLTYTFAPVGPTIAASGLVNAMTLGSNYTVTAGSATCTSVASVSFANDIQLVTPAIPTITSIAASCTANETSTISNYDNTLTYTFAPAGPTIAASGLVSGMTLSTNYTVTAGNTNCTSVASTNFANDSQLVTPVIPTITSVAVSCTADETSTISNYDNTLTYTFAPTGPTIAASGLVNSMTLSTNYTVTAGNTNCTSNASVSFNNDTQLVTPAIPTITSVATSCTANETSTISNYDNTLTYTFSPTGPTIAASGLVSGMTLSTNYTVTAGNTNCTSAASVSFANDTQLVTPTIGTLSNLPLTDVGNNGTENFDLTQNTTAAANGSATVNVTYYETMANANAGTGNITTTTVYPNTANPQTIYVRVEGAAPNNCFITGTFQLLLNAPPVSSNTPADQLDCDADADGIGAFEFDNLATEVVVGNPANFTVTVHETQANAMNDLLPLSSPYTNISLNTQTVYVRIEDNTTPTNFVIESWNLIVNPTPQILDTITTTEICDDTSANGIAVFDLTLNETLILDGLTPTTNYLFSYFSSEINAEANTGAFTNPTNYSNIIPFNETIWVRISDNPTANANGCFSIVAMNLVVNANPLLVQPNAMQLCDVNNTLDEKEVFTLSDANAEILNTQTGITLSYHLTQNGADTNTEILTNSYENIVNPQTVFVRALNNVTNCVSTVLLTLEVNPLPTPLVNPTPYKICDLENDGISNLFDFSTQTILLLNGETNVTITYHETIENANDGTMDLPNMYTNISAFNQIIYVRAENNTTNCFTVVELPLEVLNSPVVPVTIDPIDSSVNDNTYIICDDNADGFNQFDFVTAVSPIVYGLQNSTDFTINYFTSLANAEAGIGAITNTGSYTNVSNPQTIWVSLEDMTTDACKTIGSFTISVQLPPVAITPTSLDACDDLDTFYYHNNDNTTTFDLTIKDSEITGGNTALSVTYHLTLATAQSATTDILDATLFTNTDPGSQTVFARVEDSTTGCFTTTTLTVRVIPNPTPTQNPMDLELCDDVSLDGIETFDLTLNETTIINGEPDVILTYYTDENDALIGTNQIIDPTMHSNEDPLIAATGISPQIIYVRVTKTIGLGCFTLVNFKVIVNPLPELPTTDIAINACELSTDGIFEFDLTQNTVTILGTQSATDYTVTYHETLISAQAGTPQIATPGAYDNTINPQEIFVNVTNTVTGCSISTLSFMIEVNEAAVANVLADYVLCDDTMEFDTDTTNDTVAFDLLSQNANVLGNDPLNPQPVTDYIVSYYLSQAAADVGDPTTALTSPYTNIVNPQTIFARVSNDTMTGTPPIDSSFCYDVTPLTLQVNPIPSFDLDDMYLICANKNGTEVLPDDVISTGLSTTIYSFQWYLEAVPITGETGSSIAPIEGGNYSVVVTYINPNTGCSNDSLDPNANTFVEVSTPPVIEAVVGTDAFADSHTIEVSATGGGISIYEFSLDGGDYEGSSTSVATYTFLNVSVGEHSITVRDKNGCGLAKETVIIMDNPTFFTPNGDGYNETWNIPGASLQPDATIYIFDRVGKLLKQISPTGAGWDGTYNGNPMPTGGYWFTIEYRDPKTDAAKQYKSYFTLKR